MSLTTGEELYFNKLFEVSDPQTDQLLKFDSTIQQFINYTHDFSTTDHNHDGIYSAIDHTHNLNDLTDVSITTPSNTQILIYNGINWENKAQTNLTITIPQITDFDATVDSLIALTNLGDLANVNPATTADNYVLQYRASQGKWIPVDLNLTYSLLGHGHNFTDVLGGISGGPVTSGDILYYTTQWEYKSGLELYANVSHTHVYTDITDWSTGFANSFNSSSIGNLTDVDLTGNATNKILAWNGTHFVPVTASSNTLEGLADTTLTSLANGNILIYNSGSAVWENKAQSNLTITASQVSDFSTAFTNQLNTKTTDNLTEGSSNLYFTNERVDDRVSSLIQNGTGIVWTYNDSLNTLTPTVSFGPFTTSNLGEGSNLYFTNERVDDRVSALIQNGTGITWSYDDGLNTLTPTVSLSAFTTANLAENASYLYYTDERVDDRVSALIQSGIGITWSYDDTLNTLTPAVSLSAFTTANLAENTNLYWTDSRFNTAFLGKTTDNLTEGASNLYWTNSRFDTRFGSKSIAELDDVVITSVADGQALIFNSVTGDFENKTPTYSTQWTTSGSNIYYNAGNVSVGTTLSSAPLTVSGVGHTQVITGSSNPSLVFHATDVAADNGKWKLYPETSSNLLLTAINDADSAATTVLRVRRTNQTIDNVNFPNGNMAVGHETASSYRLDVSGVLYLRGGATGANPTPHIKFADYYDNAGAPSISHIDLYGGSYGFGISDGTVNYISDDNHAFYTDTDLTTPILYLDGDGSEVGIGTNDPKTELHIASEASYATTLRLGAITAGYTSADIGAQTKVNQITFSSYRDTVQDTIGAKIAAINYNMLDAGLVQYTDLVFYTLGAYPSTADSTVERMRITRYGNVGIGTSNPTAKLCVAGQTDTSVNWLLQSDGTIQGTDDATTRGLFNCTGTMAPTYAGTIQDVRGIWITPTFSPASGTTINYATGLYVDVGSQSGAGTISNGIGLVVLHPAFGDINWTAQLSGSSHGSFFAYGANEHTYIRGGLANSKVIINDSSSLGNVWIGDNITSDPNKRLVIGCSAGDGISVQKAGDNNQGGRLEVGPENGSGVSDGASYTVHNFRISSWYGFGLFCSFDSTCRHVFDTRTGNSRQTGNIEAGIDTDIGCAFGRALVGYVGFSDHAGFSHLDCNNSTDYAILQENTGETFINAKSGQQINFNINNTAKTTLDASRLDLSVPIQLNTITETARDALTEAKGDTIYNTDTDEINYSNGSVWLRIPFYSTGDFTIDWTTTVGSCFYGGSSITSTARWQKVGNCVTLSFTAVGATCTATGPMAKTAILPTAIQSTNQIQTSHITLYGASTYYHGLVLLDTNGDIVIYMTIPNGVFINGAYGAMYGDFHINYYLI